MTDFVHHRQKLNGLDYHFVTAGSGPPVLFLHGFPDLWLGWQPVMERFADAGFMAIAPDLRGFGESQAADGVDQATAFDVLGDLIALLDHLGIARTAVVAHDWGAAVAWPIVQLRPDRFGALAALSVPFQPRGSASMVDVLRQNAPPDLYFRYFLEEGVAEQELDADPERFLRRLFFTNSGERPGDDPPSMRLASNGRLIDALDEPGQTSTSLSAEHLARYAESFRRTGFRGALNTYRSLHRTWELLAGWADQPPGVPSIFLAGTRDVGLQLMGGVAAAEKLGGILPGAEPPVLFDGLGHFIQIEAPGPVADRLLDFFGRWHPDARSPSSHPDRRLP